MTEIEQFNTKRGKQHSPRLHPQLFLAIREVRDEYPYELYPVVMEDCVNKKLDEIHRDISEHDIETNLNATKMVIEKYPDGRDDDEKKKH